MYEQTLMNTDLSPPGVIPGIVVLDGPSIKGKYFTQTQLLIAPLPFSSGIRLITNFHQPQSTLLVLVVAAAVGDKWRDLSSVCPGS